MDIEYNCNPKKVGVYRTSRVDIMSYGSTYGFWDGVNWFRFKNWGDYTKAPNFIWQGCGESKREPFNEEDL